MANEVSLVEPAIDFKPTPIVISNLDQVQEAVAEYVAKYDTDFVVTSANATDVRRMRASLHKVSKAFDEKRLAVQRQVKAPLAEFNTTMKGLKQQIDSVIDPLDVKLKEVKEQERAAKLKHVREMIAEMAPNYGVSEADVPTRDSWLNKAVSDKRISEEVAADMAQLKKDQDQRATDIQTIRTYADQLELESSGWGALVTKGEPVLEIMADMDHAAAQRDEQRIRDKERERKVKEAQAAIDATHQVKQGDETVDTETGEVVPEVITLKLTGSHKQLAQAWLGIKNLGIQVEMLSKE